MEAPSVDALLADGERLEASGDLNGALRRYREAMGLAPSSALVQVCVGNALFALGRLDEAEAHYRRSAALDPDYAAARLNLGNVLMLTGRAADAVGEYRAATQRRGDWAEAWAGLGCALEESRQVEAAIDAYRDALRLERGHAGAAFNLSGLLLEREPEAARRVLLDALSLNAGHPGLLRALAHLHRKLDEHREAIEVYRRLVAADPDDASAASNLLFTLGFLPDATAESLLAEHRAWGARLAARIPAERARTDADPARRLRIGYLSPDFHAHAVAVFMLPLLREHDHAAVEVFCYASHERDDEFTGRLRALADHWRPIYALDDDAVAQQIRQDRIDLLIDLAGHTSGNRLRVCARQPAPVLATWLGYLGTTGLPAIDYRICDRHTDPEGRAERWQTETPARLPDSQWCYEPALDVPTGPLPFRARGYWTFGSFNQLAKLNEPLMELWAELLEAVPGSRLRVAGLPGAHLPEKLAAVFARRRIAPERIEAVGRVPLQDYFIAHNDVDIALDSFPYTGGTTTCDALLMGVPVATIAGDRPVARSGVSLLNAVGLADWVAPSRDALVALVCRQIAQPERLAQLRAELPARMRASPLMDARRFARDMEALYRTLWKTECARAR